MGTAGESLTLDTRHISILGTHFVAVMTLLIPRMALICGEKLERNGAARAIERLSCVGSLSSTSFEVCGVWPVYMVAPESF